MVAAGPPPTSPTQAPATRRRCRRRQRRRCRSAYQAIVFRARVASRDGALAGPPASAARRRQNQKAARRASVSELVVETGSPAPRPAGPLKLRIRPTRYGQTECKHGPGGGFGHEHLLRKRAAPGPPLLLGSRRAAPFGNVQRQGLSAAGSAAGSAAAASVIPGSWPGAPTAHGRPVQLLMARAQIALSRPVRASSVCSPLLLLVQGAPASRCLAAATALARRARRKVPPGQTSGSAPAPTP